MNKEFKTIEEQIEILKERNLIVNEETAKDIFRDNNYYYVINGYKDLFIDNSSEDEKYKNKTTLEEIFSLYEFDSELRSIFLKYILMVERRMNTYIAYEFSKKYGEQNYLITTNFNDNSKVNNSKIKKLIGDINFNMNMQIINGNKMLTHYMANYGYVPLWVLIRIITFGQISKFYELMKQIDQNKIAKNFGIREKEFGQYCNGYRDLFSIVIILKILLDEKDFKKFYNMVISIIEELRCKIRSIDFSEILDKMGFCLDYEKFPEFMSWQMDMNISIIENEIGQSKNKLTLKRKDTNQWKT